LPETVAAEAEDSAPKLGIVYDDPHDDRYHKVKGLPIYILQKEEA